MNKFNLMHKVLLSDLKAENKTLLIELILLSNDKGESFPSVERLSQVRGIKHSKNFEGVDKYLPGLVLVSKRNGGRANLYTLNTPAIEGLSVIDTPAVEGVTTPANPEDTPAVADNTPAVEGSNSTKTLQDSSEDSRRGVVDDATPSNNTREVNDMDLDKSELMQDGLRSRPLSFKDAIGDAEQLYYYFTTLYKQKMGKQYLGTFSAPEHKGPMVDVIKECTHQRGRELLEAYFNGTRNSYSVKDFSKNWYTLHKSQREQEYDAAYRTEAREQTKDRVAAFNDKWAARTPAPPEAAEAPPTPTAEELEDWLNA